MVVGVPVVQIPPNPGNQMGPDCPGNQVGPGPVNQIRPVDQIIC